MPTWQLLPLRVITAATVMRVTAMQRRSVIDAAALILPVVGFALVEVGAAHAAHAFSEAAQVAGWLAVVLLPAIPGLRVRSLFRLRSDVSVGAVAIILYALYFVLFFFGWLVIYVGITGDGP